MENENKRLIEEICNYKVHFQKLEDEKQSLLTAMGMLIKENNTKGRSQRTFIDLESNSTKNNDNAPKDDVNESNNESSKINRNNNQLSKEQKKKKTRAGESRPSTGNKSSETSPSLDETKVDSPRQPNRLNTVIIGDSVISRIEGWRLSTDNRRVSVKSFSGAKVEDMSHYVKPTLTHAPDEIIIHVGTNNLKKESPEGSVIRLKSYVQ